MIVKIQQSQFTTTDNHQMLVYNRDRNIFFESDLTKEVKKLLRGRPKGYFEVNIVNEKIQVLREVKTQNW